MAMRGNMPRSVTGDEVIEAIDEKSASADDILFKFKY